MKIMYYFNLLQGTMFEESLRHTYQTAFTASLYVVFVKNFSFLRESCSSEAYHGFAKTT